MCGGSPGSLSQLDAVRLYNAAHLSVPGCWGERIDSAMLAFLLCQILTIRVVAAYPDSELAMRFCSQFQAGKQRVRPGRPVRGSVRGSLGTANWFHINVDSILGSSEALWDRPKPPPHQVRRHTTAVWRARAARQKNHQSVFLKYVSEVVGRIKTLWERSMMILGKSIFDDFSTPKFSRIGKF